MTEQCVNYRISYYQINNELNNLLFCVLKKYNNKHFCKNYNKICSFLYALSNDIQQYNNYQNNEIKTKIRSHILIRIKKTYIFLRIIRKDIIKTINFIKKFSKNYINSIALSIEEYELDFINYFEKELKQFNEIFMKYSNYVK